MVLSQQTVLHSKTLIRQRLTVPPISIWQQRNFTFTVVEATKFTVWSGTKLSYRNKCLTELKGNNRVFSSVGLLEEQSAVHTSQTRLLSPSPTFSTPDYCSESSSTRVVIVATAGCSYGSSLVNTVNMETVQGTICSSVKSLKKQSANKEIKSWYLMLCGLRCWSVFPGQIC